MIAHDFVIPKQKPLPAKMQDNPLGSPSIFFIIGPVGSGKSTTMANILLALQKEHKFDTGLFVTSNNRDPIIDSIEIPVTTSPVELENYITELKQAKEGTNHILVLDDIQGSKDFNLMTNRSNFVNFVLSHRHFGESKSKPNQNGVWILITAQTLKSSMTPMLRDQVKNWFLYYPRRPKDIKNYEEIAIDPTSMQRGMSLVKNAGSHAFMYLNKHDPMEDQYFLGFKEPMRDLM